MVGYEGWKVRMKFKVSKLNFEGVGKGIQVILSKGQFTDDDSVNCCFEYDDNNLDVQLQCCLNTVLRDFSKLKNEGEK